MPSDTVQTQHDFESLLAQAEAARDAGEIMQALTLAQQALDLATGDREKARALCLVGRYHGMLGDFRSAEPALVEALRLAADMPDVLVYVKLHVGTVRWMQGQLDVAKQFLGQAIDGLRRLGDQPHRLRALGNLGLVLLARGEFQEAISTYEETLELARNLNNWLIMAINLNNLGECYQDLGDLEKARELHERALAVAQEHDVGEYAQIDALRNLGVDLLRLGQIDPALKTIEQALALARTHRLSDLELQGMISLGEVYLAQGKCEQAEGVAKQLIQASAGVPIRLAEARLLLGRCHLERNDTMQAVILLETGLIDAQASYSKMRILRLHAALSQIVSHPAIAEVHRRIAAELIEQIADTLHNKALRTTFLRSPLAASVTAK